MYFHGVIELSLVTCVEVNKKPHRLISSQCGNIMLGHATKQIKYDPNGLSLLASALRGIRGIQLFSVRHLGG